MSSRQLPESLNFIKQAEKNVSLEGYWPIADLVRLKSSLNETSGEVFARLKFGSRSGFYCLSGSVEANLNVICQRCIEPMVQAVTGHFIFGLITSEDEIALLPSDMEPYLVAGNDHSVIEIIEDELMLSLPMVIAHAEVCSEYLKDQEEQRRKEAADEHPFAVLKSLKIEES